MIIYTEPNKSSRSPARCPLDNSQLLTELSVSLFGSTMNTYLLLCCISDKAAAQLVFAGRFKHTHCYHQKLQASPLPPQQEPY